MNSIVAIGNQDKFAHIYPDEQTLLADGDIGRGVGESPFALEFFNTEGQRLAGVYDENWQLVRLMPTGDGPGQEVLEERLGKVIDNLRAFIDGHPEVMALYGFTVEEAIELVDSSVGSRGVRAPNLQVLAAHGAPFTAGLFGEDHDGSFIHDWIHH
jgi:hypothetical protein